MTISSSGDAASPTSRGGETGAAIRRYDWSQTSVGPREHWPSLLRSTLSLVLESPESLYLLWGPQKLFFFNDAYRPVLGPRLDTALGQTIETLWADAWPDVQFMVEQAFLGHSCRHVDLPVNMHRYPGEALTWWSFSMSPVYDEQDEQVVGVLCHTVETTDRVLLAEHARQTEARLRETRELNTRVLASSNDCIKVLDLNGQLSFMSEGGLRVMEVSDFNAIAGCPWPEFWQDQGRLDAQAAIAAARAGQAARFQGAAQTLAGTCKWWDVQVTPMLDAAGLPEKILCISRDISATREAEEALRRLNESLEQRVQARTQERDRIWQLSTELMLVADFNGRIIAVNPAWTRLLGWQRHELEGSSVYDFIHPQDSVAAATASADLTSGQSFSRVENRFRHKDGSYRWVSWSAVPDPQHVHAVGRDIQAEREAAQALRKTEDILRQAQKMEAVGQLTGGVAHDFNNLLTVIRSSTDLLRRTLDEKRRQLYINAISDTVDRASKLTGQLLAYARQQNLRPETFDVGASVQLVAQMINPLIGACIELRIELPEQPCYIHADAGQLDTALINMAVNARDAMQGEGLLVIAVERVTQIAASASQGAQAGDFVAISLTDTGAGIDPQQLERIFEPFFTTKEVGKGTGLGLSQVFGFAKQSGGGLAVDSQPGQGTRFTLYLPRCEALADVAPARCSAAVPIDGQGLTLLVVEDNPEVGVLLAQALNELGYQVEWATSATEALARLSQERASFQAVFSDVVMPGMNGIELATKIRSEYPGLPVILTSGYSPALALGQTREFVFLQKPYSVAALAQAIQSCKF
ncbi:PAS domain-containing sensor histidine kinase [Pseudomonas sp. PH1b]|uniref:hybrid sensor histidine kinase/response regulator n=1 Tax=Pseudomonas sp. PH1b TaxID=1397282 RepID=UPI00046A4F2F|nr:PAS domain-containing sensor histidine kinase [Pseudomonas sp. PH1b]BFD43294.1 PAS domain-containing protein [Pseudomonas sp. FFPRI_1]